MYSEKQKENKRNYYHKNIEVQRLKNREYYKNNKQKCLDYFKSKPHEEKMLLKAKARAKTLSLDFNLDLSDIVIPKYCPALGIELKIMKGKAQDCSPSLDRIDNTKGYVKNNVHVISHRANSIKRNSSLKELRMIVEYLETIHEAQ